MLLLAIDTSGRQGGISLAHGDANNFEIVESAEIAGGTFSAELIPQIAQLLRKHALDVRDLGGLVAVTGPGSFTGLRVGLTAVKALAEVVKAPIAAVTSLEVLLAAAESAGRIVGRIVAILDAGRGEVYASFQNGQQREELLLTIEEAAQLAKERTLCPFVCDANLGAKFENSESVTYCSSEVAARLGRNKLLRKESVDVLALDANYIRKSEAEYMQKLRR
ncbi:MAG: tRNA (adenosine(37)-N6)-threonylcarbamoyltransferase complex dimerization subunit type 1 TsaB [Acidobacteria bacterium]|nr:tRNA (adenosine(37)-N6)-threonylcarbamoyltransferase complex dimerization subunit type 1 TsaB [Acidobacteriota bacterium]MBV9146008.1 tRNA (adenosine(37)-N6)-threonylcarbamoyltransferase complex dimerization subunit type 1 TsaB [Acidobacteriota bacterium]MBV9435717.1 tRNA (adenosine(37)-N6)-threonylcarbamoyltransferase complex dimerization subunit type 1 TsaB [Acidobacteriota bacterium]